MLPSSAVTRHGLRVEFWLTRVDVDMSALVIDHNCMIE